MATGSKIIVLALCGAMLGLGIYGIVDPLFYSPERAAQVEMLNTPGSRTVFTTYFYWYKSGGTDLVNSPHCTENWTTSPSYPPKVPLNASGYPEGWPGPTDPALMVQNDTGTWGWHDACSYHPPAELPEYNATGGVIESSLKNGTMEHMGTWFDWMNASWHEWELRGMMRAGIDVLIPVYWWNGIHNYWAYEGVQTLVSSWNDLAPKIATEQSITLSEAMAAIPKIALFYDTTCMKQLWAYNKSLTGPETSDWYFENGTGANLDDDYWQERFWIGIDYFIGLLEDNSTYLWNDRYVVWMYSDGWFDDVGTEVLEYCRQKCLAKYGRSIYFVGPDGWYKAGADGLCNWGACNDVVRPQPRGTIPCAGVGPGFYNLGAIALQTPLYTARDFTRYQQEWRQVMDDGAAWVHVETWNELHEGTNIAWTQEYGWDWIDATRAMADEFHAMTGYDVRSTINWTGVFVTIGAMVALLGVAVVVMFFRRL